MKPIKVKVNKSTRLHLLELKEKLSQMKLNDEQNLRAIGSDGGCGAVCMITCSYYCMPTCTTVCQDVCRGISGGGGPLVCEVLQIPWWY